MLVAILRVDMIGVREMARGMCAVARGDDPHNRQPEALSKLEITLVVPRYRHDGPSAILHQDVIGDPDRNRLTRCWIDCVRTGEHARLLAVHLPRHEILP